MGSALLQKKQKKKKDRKKYNGDLEVLLNVRKNENKRMRRKE
jgi:hypothetical protein